MQAQFKNQHILTDLSAAKNANSDLAILFEGLTLNTDPVRTKPSVCVQCSVFVCQTCQPFSINKNNQFINYVFQRVCILGLTLYTILCHTLPHPKNIRRFILSAEHIFF